jgi:hypothetical protein
MRADAAKQRYVGSGRHEFLEGAMFFHKTLRSTLLVCAALCFFIERAGGRARRYYEG